MEAVCSLNILVTTHQTAKCHNPKDNNMKILYCWKTIWLFQVIMSGNNLTKTVYIPTALKKQESPVISSSIIQENSKAQVRLQRAIPKPVIFCLICAGTLILLLPIPNSSYKGKLERIHNVFIKINTTVVHNPQVHIFQCSLFTFSTRGSMLHKLMHAFRKKSVSDR